MSGELPLSPKNLSGLINVPPTTTPWQKGPGDNALVVWLVKPEGTNDVTESNDV